MKSKIFIFIVGMLIGSLITSVGFLIFGNILLYCFKRFHLELKSILLKYILIFRLCYFLLEMAYVFYNEKQAICEFYSK